MEGNDAAPPAPAKLDPESLVLRGKPQAAARFRRGVLLGAAAIGSCGIATLGFVALRPHVHLAGNQASDLSQPAGTATPDALTGLPPTYAGVPRLGPPLPGDLGKPILDQQRADLVASPPPASCDSDIERQRKADEIRAARQSALLAHMGDVSPKTADPQNGADTLGGSQSGAIKPADGGSGEAGQEEKAAFVKSMANDGPINPHQLIPAVSSNLLSAGSVIAASLITGLRSDLPGLVTALVTENVYDSPTGQHLLIPQGARLIGKYDSVVAFGQRRALVMWQRIIWPDGRSLAIDNMPATDPSGYAGLEDRVDFHSWQLLRGAGISTLLGIGAQLQFSGGSDLVDAIRQSSQQSVSRSGDQLVSRSLDIQPTITIRPGTPVRLLVHHDIVVDPIDGGRP